MAASVFPGSCVIYWISWIMSLAYVLGITVYETTHIPVLEEYTNVSTFIKLICYIIIGMAFVGCVFVKCDISHYLCFLCYTVPLLLIVPGLCIYGLIYARALPNVIGANAHDRAKSHLHSEGNLPTWLKNSEIEHDCCGMFSWKDYYLDFSKPVQSFPVLPNECCKNIDVDKNPKAQCLNASMETDFLVTIDEAIQSKEENNTDTKAYKDRLMDSNFPYLNNKYRSIINTRGCNRSLIVSARDLKDSHVTFLILLFICSFTMAIAYIKNWCVSRPFYGGRPDHSLDVETVSLLDIPQAKPIFNLTPTGTQHSLSSKLKRSAEASKIPVKEAEEVGSVGISVPKINTVFGGETATVPGGKTSTRLEIGSIDEEKRKPANEVKTAPVEKIPGVQNVPEAETVSTASNVHGVKSNSKPRKPHDHELLL